MAASVVGFLSAGFEGQRRDYYAIREGLQDEGMKVDWLEVWTASSVGIARLKVNTPSPSADIHLVEAFAEGHWGQLRALADKLVLNFPAIELFVGTSTPAIGVLKDARFDAVQQAKPIIMAFSGDPIHAGIIDSGYPNGPWNRITGIIDHNPDQAVRQADAVVDLYRHWNGGTAPSNVFILHNSDNKGKEGEITDLETEAAAQIGPGSAQRAALTKAGGVTQAILAGLLGTAHTVVVMGDPLTFENAGVIRNYFNTRGTKIPVVFGAPEAAEAGALMACGPKHKKIWKEAAKFIVKALKNPEHTDTGGSLKFYKNPDVELWLNKITAGNWGKSFSATLDAKADQVIS